MGQYWIPVNLTKREFVDPHKLGTGLKLWEQLASHPGTGAALVVLLANQVEKRGGGDLEITKESKQVIGRWAGDKIAIIGDYAEEGDLKGVDTEVIYDLCCGSLEDCKRWYREKLTDERYKDVHEIFRRKLRKLKGKEPFQDISERVLKVIRRELKGLLPEEE